MNLNKFVHIKDFVIKEVIPNLKGQLMLNNKKFEDSFIAGSQILFFFHLFSTCGNKLRIYQNEFNNTILKQNGEDINYDKIKFNNDSMALEISVSNYIIGTYIYEII